MAYRDRNWIRAIREDWEQSATYGVAGDWIQRLGIETDSADSDTDTDTDADADADSDTDTDTDTDADTDGAELALFAISPNTTPVGVAASVVLNGAGFDEGATVNIGGLAAVGAEVQSAEVISARTPGALGAGTYDVEVRNPDGESDVLAAAFIVTGDEEEVVEEEEDPKFCACAHGSPAGALGWAGVLAAAAAQRRRRN
jgi:MYXO-CTERM domain-containing protein